MLSLKGTVINFEFYINVQEYDFLEIRRHAFLEINKVTFLKYFNVFNVSIIF